jgi:hypothetical protein
MPASDPRFLSTLNQILKAPEKGGLVANNLTFRYDFEKSQVIRDSPLLCLSILLMTMICIRTEWEDLKELFSWW